MSRCNPLYQCPPLPYREGQNRRFYPLKEWVRGYKEDPERRRFSLFALCSMLFFTSAHYSERRLFSRFALASIVLFCTFERLPSLSSRLFLDCSRGDFSLFARCSLAFLGRFSTASRPVHVPKGKNHAVRVSRFVTPFIEKNEHCQR